MPTDAVRGTPGPAVRGSLSITRSLCSPPPARRNFSTARRNTTTARLWLFRSPPDQPGFFGWLLGTLTSSSEHEHNQEHYNLLPLLHITAKAITANTKIMQLTILCLVKQPCCCPQWPQPCRRGPVASRDGGARQAREERHLFDAIIEGKLIFIIRREYFLFCFVLLCSNNGQ
jgi:hypothetical protein